MRRSSSRRGSTNIATLLEKGAAVLVTLSAALEGEDVRARIVAVEPLAAAAARAQKGLRIVVEDESRSMGLRRGSRARATARCRCSSSAMSRREEIEIRLPGGYPVTAEVAERAARRFPACWRWSICRELSLNLSYSLSY